MVTENIPVKRDFFKQIRQQSTNMKGNQFAVASKERLPEPESLTGRNMRK